MGQQLLVSENSNACVRNATYCMLGESSGGGKFFSTLTATRESLKKILRGNIVYRLQVPWKNTLRKLYGMC